MRVLLNPQHTGFLTLQAPVTALRQVPIRTLRAVRTEAHHGLHACRVLTMCCACQMCTVTKLVPSCLLLCLQANIALPTDDGQWLHLRRVRVLTTIPDILD